MKNWAPSSEESDSDIAVIGMSGRFPGAGSVDQLWHNLCAGTESVTFFSEEELIESGIDPAVAQNPNYVRAAAILEDPGLFDASFFGYTPRGARITDPQHRLFLECAWEALEHAGYDADRYKGRIGVYGGALMNTYLLFSGLLPNFLAEYLDILIGNHNDYLTTLVSYKLNLKGPSVTVQTACSTSLVAVHMACQSLLNEESDMALAGGVAVRVPHKAGYFYQEGSIFSPDGHCRAFDAMARGTIFGSGVGIVVLKRLEDALADGDCIHAVIKGSAINNDGSSKVSYAAPSVDSQAEVIVEAMANAGVEADSISYVEAHGTGTALGDPIEITALTKAFRAYTDKTGFCGIGSVKTNIGHLDNAAGIASLIKVVLALKHKVVPPSLHYEKPNPGIDFEKSPFYVNTTLSEWKSNSHPRRAGVSGLGVGGTNAHVVLEEAPELEPSGQSRPWQLLLLSARTSTALDTMTTRLIDHLKKHPGLDLPDVAYSLQIGRKTFKHRQVAVCRDLNDAVASLEKPDPQRVIKGNQEPANRDIAFMFSGQGSQYVNMGLELYGTEKVFQEEIDRCSEILRPFLSLDLRHVLYPPEESKEDTAETLKQTYVTQPALFVIEYALAKLWMSWGVSPRALAGHSIGEYVAACLAGVFTLEDALSLVAARGRMMQDLPGGSMLIVPLAENVVQPLLSEELSLAVINAPSLCVVSGEKEAIENLKSRLSEKSLNCHNLHTSHAFHSGMMEPIVDSFAERVAKVKLNSPQIPFVSNVTGTWITSDEATNPRYWARHLRQTVRFCDNVQELLKEPNRVLLEVGPGYALSSLVRLHPNKSKDHVVLSSMRHPKEEKSDVAFILNTLGRLWLAGCQVDWTGFYKDEDRHRVPLPTYPFERRRYWLEQAIKAPLSDIDRPSVEDPDEKGLARQEEQPVPKGGREQLVLELKGVVEQASGLDLKDLDEYTPFLEMGFDSMFMVRLFSIFQGRLSLKVTLAEFLEKFPSIGQLVDGMTQESTPEQVAERHKNQIEPDKSSALISGVDAPLEQGAQAAVVRKIRKGVEMIRKKQFKELGSELLKSIFPTNNCVFYWDKFFVMELAAFEDIPIKLEMEAVVAAEEDIKRLASKLPDKEAFFNRKWSEGQKCLVVKDRDDIVAYCWLIDGRTKYRTNSAWTFIPPRQGAMWCDDVYVDDRYRSRGPYLALMRKMYEIAESRRQLPIYSEIHYLNVFSLRSAVSSGHRIVRTVSFFSIFGLKVYFVRDDNGGIQLDKAYALRVKLI